MPTTTVRNLAAGQVVSLPDAQLAPAVIVAISEPVGDVRFIELTDLESGEPVGRRLVLGLDRVVVVHKAVVAHHYYTNDSNQVVEVRLGRRVERVAAGETLHYTGEPRPDQFPAPPWTHVEEPLAVAQEPRPI